jgi:hypothetical protein
MIPDPPPGSGADGVRLVAGLDAVLLGVSSGVALEAQHALLLEEIIARADGPLRGLDPEGVPSDALEALRWAGVPLAPAGAIRWGNEMRPGKVEQPCFVEGTLEIPDAAVLRACNGVQLKQLRRFCADHLGVRLQAAPGVALYLWANQALVVSLRDEDLAGFLHGPETGQRHSLAWAPGEPLWVRW